MLSSAKLRHAVVLLVLPTVSAAQAKGRNPSLLERLAESKQLIQQGSASGQIKHTTNSNNSYPLEQQGQGDTYAWEYDGEKLAYRFEHGASFVWDGTRGYTTLVTPRGVIHDDHFQYQGIRSSSLDPITIGYKVDWPWWPRIGDMWLADFVETRRPSVQLQKNGMLQLAYSDQSGGSRRRWMLELNPKWNYMIRAVRLVSTPAGPEMQSIKPTSLTLDVFKAEKLKDIWIPVDVRVVIRGAEASASEQMTLTRLSAPEARQSHRARGGIEKANNFFGPLLLFVLTLSIVVLLGLSLRRLSASRRRF